MSVVVQKQNGTWQGNPNPSIYRLLNAESNPFHATPSGNNSVPEVNGFTASGAAYNLATGLGSVDANLLVNAWPASGGTAPPKPSPTLRVSAAAGKVSVVQGRTATLLVTATTSGSFSGTVTLAVTGLPAGVSATWGANGLKATGSGNVRSTLILKATGDAALKTATMTITATGDELQARTSAVVEVTPPAGIKLGLSAALVEMKPTGTQSVTASVIPQGRVTVAANMTGVSFNVIGLPMGVSGSWGAPRLTEAGTAQVVLTLKGSKSAVGSNSRLTITGNVTDPVSGTLYSASQQESLVVAKVTSAGPLPIQSR
jgi:hypothetical protein